jgi:hypothetical protein
LISKGNSHNSEFARFRGLSPTIGHFFALSIAERILRKDEKRPSAFYRTTRLRWLCLSSVKYVDPPDFEALSGLGK